MIRLFIIILSFYFVPLTTFSQCECDYGVAYEPSPGLCYVINACSDQTASNYCPGDSYFNENCIYDTDEVVGCTCSIAYNYNPSATVDDGNCIIIGGCSDLEAFNYSICGSVFYNENCIYGGCTDPNACNYNPSISQDDGSCEYPEVFHDCDGNCLIDTDGDGVCDENEFSGCADPMAENYFCQSSDACGFDFSTGFPIFILPEEFNEDGSCVYDGVDENGDGIPDNSLQGCADQGALNYNSNFSVWSPLSYINNFSEYQSIICVYPVYGCIDVDACNYNEEANTTDGSCEYPLEYYDCTGICLNDTDGDGVCNENEVTGCTDSDAYNYNTLATDDDGSCIMPILGCTSEEAFNYNPDATQDDGSCVQTIIGCSNIEACNYDPNVNSNNEELCIYFQNGYDCVGNCLSDTDGDGVCDEFEIMGCTDLIASNYNSEATDSDNNLCEYITECSCEYGSAMQVGDLCYIINACSDPDSNNYCFGDQYFNEYCEYEEISFGCTCEDAANYNSLATEDDGSCVIVGGCNDIEANNYTNCLGVYYNEVCLYYGCNDITACNYNNQSNYNDGSCEYPEEDYLDCFGNCLNDVNQNGICDQIEGGTVQTIQLEQGWNIFSSNLLLENPNVEDVMSPVSSGLLIVKDDAGNIYWPMVEVNQIQDFQIGKAYMSKMTFDIPLDFIGSSIEPENIVLELEEGWGFLGYLRDEPMDVLQVVANDFVDIRNDLIIMKDGFGNVLWPDYELNSIQTMYPGQGYLIKMSTETEFSFLPNNFEYYHLPLVWPDSNNPLDLQTTGGNATMMINLNANEILLDENPIETGDKVGVFYEGQNKWLCAGFLIWDDNMPPAALTIWGNIEDGFGLMEGDNLKMFILDSSTGNNYTVENTWNDQGYFINGDMGYMTNGLYQTSSMSTDIYVEGFNARFGSITKPISKFETNFNRTNSSMIIAIPDYSWGFLPDDLSEILAFDSYGNLVGSSVYNQGSISLAIWGDDLLTDQKDGMEQNEKINLKYWCENLNIPIDLDVAWELGDAYYIPNGLAAISSINLSNYMIDHNVIEIFPNPCRDFSKLSFDLSSDDFVEIKILNLQGKEISLAYSDFMLQGTHQLDLNTSLIKKGTYIISIKSKYFQKEVLLFKI